MAIGTLLVPVLLLMVCVTITTKNTIFIDGLVTDIVDVPSHTDELPYLFYSPEYAYSTNATELLMQDKMVTLWTNFAKYL